MSRYNQRPLRLLAPKISGDQVGHSYDPIIDQLSLEPDHTNVNAQQTSTGHTELHSGQYFPTSSPLQSDNAILTLKRNEDAAVLQTDNWVREVPVVPANIAFLGLGHGNLAPRVVNPDCPGFSAPQLPHGQLPDILHYHHGQDYWVPPPDVPSPHRSFYQHSPGLSQQLPGIQSAQHAQTRNVKLNKDCNACPRVWCFHLESIMLSDPQDKGAHILKQSYRELRQHIHEAHWHQFETTCPLCENLFCYHGGKMMLLEIAKGDLADLKVDLGRSFMTLRDHIKEAHGGC